MTKEKKGGKREKMENKKTQKAITLIALIITIVILLILAGITIKSLTGENGLITQTNLAKQKHIKADMKEELSVALQELQTEKTGNATIDDITQEWIDKAIETYECTVQEDETIDGKIIIMKQNEITEKFIIDNDLNITQIEDDESSINLTYEIVYIEGNNAQIIIKVTDQQKGIEKIEYPDGKVLECNGKKQVAIDYTVELGIEYKFKIISKDGQEKEEIIKIEDETWDGWIKLNLYYPTNAINKMWRLGEEGEIRSSLNLEWYEYTGPITIPMSRTKDVWIKYDLDNKQVIQPSEDSVLVYIQNEEIENNHQKITIEYDEQAILKEYNIDGTGWKTYTGEFTIQESSLIMARAKKQENVYDNSGNLITTQDKWGTDNKYIVVCTEQTVQDLIDNGTITEEKKEETEDKIQLDKIKEEYPELKDEIDKIEEQNPEMTDGEIIEEIIKGHPEVEEPEVTPEEIIKDLIEEGEIEPDDVEEIPESAKDIVEQENVLKAPQIIVTPETEKVEQVTVKIETQEEAREIYIKVGEQEYIKYENEIEVSENVLISAYYISEDGQKSKVSYKQITNIKKENLPYLAIKADPYPYPNDTGRKQVKITLEYQDANNVEYSEDGDKYYSYIEPFIVTKNERVYAKATNLKGTTTAYLDITNIGDITEAPEKPSDSDTGSGGTGEDTSRREYRR